MRKVPVLAALLAAVAVGTVQQVAGGRAQPAVVPAPGFPTVLPGVPSAPTIAQAPSAAPIATPATPTPPPEVAARPMGPDETALRYFARQGDTRRVEVETARLRALYPDWTPPADLNAPAPVGDALLDNMWSLFAQGRIAEARAAVAERMTAERGWTPPAELLARLDEAEAVQRIANAADLRQWRSVVDLATETPSVLTCAYVDVMWRLAEAFARTERAQRARDAYAYVLANCTNPGERLATAQKAIDLIPEDMFGDLFALERVVAGAGEFEPVRDTLARRHVGTAAEDPDATAERGELDRVAALARAGGDESDPSLLGFYYLRHGEPRQALPWFQSARSRNEASAKVAEGYVLTLNELGRALEAEPVAYEFIDATPENLRAYLDVITSVLTAVPPPRLTPEVLARMTQAVGGERDGLGGQAFGWYAYNLSQITAARAWFEKALIWQTDNEPAAYGLALVFQREGNVTAMRSIIAEWGGRSLRIAALGDPARRVDFLAPSPVPLPAPAPRERLVGAEPTPGPRDAVILYDVVPLRDDVTPGAPLAAPVPRTVQVAGAGITRNCDATALAGQVQNLSGGAALARAWCLMERDRPMEAVAAFDVALAKGGSQVRQDAAYGKSLAFLRENLTDAAAVAATQAPVSGARQRELTVALLTRRALEAFDSGRFADAILSLERRARLAPEQNDLMLLRGYAYARLGDVQEARRVFAALAALGIPEGRIGLGSLDPHVE